MSQVVVSYDLKDSAAIEPIKRALQAAGLSVGFAQTTCRTEIKSARCVLIVWSKAAADSESLQEEVRRDAISAWSSGRLLLVALDDVPLPVGLRDVAPIRLGGEKDSGLSQLVERAKAIVAASKARETRAEAPSTLARAETLDVAARSEILSHATPRPLARRRFGRFSSLALAGLAICVALIVGSAALYYVRFAGPPGGIEPRPNLPLPPPSDSAPKPKSRSIELEPYAGPLEPYAGPLGPYAGPLGPQSGPSHVPREREETASTASRVEEFLLIGVLLCGMAIGAVAIRVLTVRAGRQREPLNIVAVTQSPANADGLQVFVSYSHLDAKAVDRLVQQIEGMGYGVWIDRATTGTHRYAEAIVHAIRASKLVALMCSHNAFASDQVIREIYLAGDFKKPFIVFQLDPTDFPDEVLYFVSGFPRIPIASVDPHQLRTEIARLIAA
jgi:TIR domain